LPNMFMPANPCAIILYGSEACARFGALVEYFNGILELPAWNQYLFVLIDHQPVPQPSLPPEKSAILLHNCWQLDINTLPGVGKPVEMIAELRNRINRGVVLLQCVFAAYEDMPSPPDALLTWLDSVQHDFTPGATRTIAYTLLRDNADAYARQNDWAQAFNNRAQGFPYLYLLGDHASDASSVSSANLWHAICGELLANSVTSRTLTGGLFSLGLSTLNANNGELTAIRRDYLSQLLREQSSRLITRQEAWELFTRTQSHCPEPDGPNLELALKTWLDNLVARQTVLPSEVERNNLRLFAGFPQADLSVLEKGINSFYTVNNGTKEASEQAATRFAGQYVQGILDTLSLRYNASRFPLPLLSQIEDALVRLAATPVRAYSPVIPPKRGLLPRAKRAQLAKRCLAIEAECERMVLSEQLRCYAAAFKTALGSIRVFVKNASELGSSLEKDRVAGGAVDELVQKYKQYSSIVRDTVETRGDRLLLGAPQNVLFAPDGKPDMECWRQLLDYGTEALLRTLPAECAGSFCQTLLWECTAHEGLNQFFGNYLRESKRILLEDSDITGTSQPQYFADVALAGHPWFSKSQKETVVAHNDNVERVDLFPLMKNLSWYIQHNRYFMPVSQTAVATSGLTRPWESDTVAPPAGFASGVPTGIPPKVTDEPPEEAGDHRLSIMIENGRHVLVWEWESGVESAVISVYSKTHRVINIVRTVEEFNASIGDLPNGVDVTEGLPYGPVRVEIRSSRGLYATKVLTGKKNEVCYHFETLRGRLTLVAEGAPTDLAKLALNVPRPASIGKALYYPLNVWDPSESSVRIKGLQLINPTSCFLDALPGDAYPTVRAVRR
jgi:hypothetical protein